MNIEILHSPGNAAAKVNLEPGEKIVSESGAMIAMSEEMNVVTSTKTKSGGGLWKGIKRAFAGDSMFLNTFTADHKGGVVFLAAQLIGDMIVYELDGTKDLIVQGGSFVACSEDVEIDTTMQGFKSSLLSGESLFWLKLSGKGSVILNSFGGIYERNLTENYIVDTGHIVAFESTLQFEVKKAGKSLFSSFMSGEGFSCYFSGSGQLFCQTHNPGSFGRTLGPKLRPRN